MWSKVASLATLLTACACATGGRSEYEATPNEAGAYSLRLTTYGIELAEHKTQLAQRASATCGGAYNLEVNNQIASVCSDECPNFTLTTLATLSCEKASVWPS